MKGRNIIYTHRGKLYTIKSTISPYSSINLYTSIICISRPFIPTNDM